MEDEKPDEISMRIHMAELETEKRCLQSENDFLRHFIEEKFLNNKEEN